MTLYLLGAVFCTVVTITLATLAYINRENPLLILILLGVAAIPCEGIINLYNKAIEYSEQQSHTEKVNTTQYYRATPKETLKKSFQLLEEKYQQRIVAC